MAAAQLDKVISDVKNYKRRFGDSWEFQEKYEPTFAKTLASVRDKDSAKLEELLIVCFRCGESQVLNCVATKLIEKRSLIDWQGRPELIDKCLMAVRDTSLREYDQIRVYATIMNLLLSILRDLRILDRHANSISAIAEASLAARDRMPDGPIHIAAMVAVYYVDWTHHVENLHRAVKELVKLVKYNPDLSEASCQCQVAYIFVCMALSKGDLSTSTLELLNKDIAELLDFCAVQEWMNSEDQSQKTIAYVMCKTITDTYLRQAFSQPHLMKPMVKIVKQLQDCDDESLRTIASTLLSGMAGDTEQTEEEIGQQLQQFLDGNLPHLMTQLIKLYQQSPGQFTPYLPGFHRLVQNSSVGLGERLMSIQLFTEIAKQQPQLITTEVTSTIGELLDDSQLQLTALMFFDSLNTRRSNDVLRYENKFLELIGSNETAVASQAGVVLVKLSGENQARRTQYMSAMATACSEAEKELHKLCIMTQMLALGNNFPRLLTPYKPLFQENLHLNALTDVCQRALNVINKFESSEQSSSPTRQNNKANGNSLPIQSRSGSENPASSPRTPEKSTTPTRTCSLI